MIRGLVPSVTSRPLRFRRRCMPRGLPASMVFAAALRHPVGSLWAAAARLCVLGSANPVLSKNAHFIVIFPKMSDLYQRMSDSYQFMLRFSMAGHIFNS